MDTFHDGGFAWTQLIANGNWVILPSVGGDISRSKFNLLSQQNGLDITIGEESWMFGETALAQSAIITRLQSDDWVFSKMYLAALLVGISETISHNTRHIDVELWTGLPYSNHQNIKFKEKFRNHLLGSHEISRQDYPKQTINIESVSVVPQNFGPIFYHIFNEKGQRKQFDREEFLIASVNIGGHTVELATAKLNLKTLKLEVIHNQCRSEPGGMFSILNPLRQVLNNQFPNEVWKDYELFKILKSDIVTLNNIDYDVSSITKPIRKRYQDRILGLISTLYSNQAPYPLSRINFLISTGGGAHVVAPAMLEMRSDLLVSESPQWDTVAGYERLSKHLRGSTK